MFYSENIEQFHFRDVLMDSTHFSPLDILECSCEPAMLSEKYVGIQPF